MTDPASTVPEEGEGSGEQPVERQKVARAGVVETDAKPKKQRWRMERREG